MRYCTLAAVHFVTCTAAVHTALPAKSYLISRIHSWSAIHVQLLCMSCRRTAVIAGGLASFNDHSSSQHNSLAATPCIHRDALALLLGRLESDVAVPRCTVLDVRRHDERTLYGSINGTLHVPGELYTLTCQCWRRCMLCRYLTFVQY